MDKLYTSEKRKESEKGQSDIARPRPSLAQPFGIDLRGNPENPDDEHVLSSIGATRTWKYKHLVSENVEDLVAQSPRNAGRELREKPEAERRQP